MTTTMILSGEATAVGDDTATAVNTVLDLVDHGPVTIGMGEVTAVAVVEDGIAYAETGAAASGDIIIIQARGKSGGGHEVSTTRIKVIDIEKIDGRTKVIYNEQNVEQEDFSLDINGNIATASIEGQVVGENTLLDVDAFVMTVEDSLSTSAVFMEAGVA